MSIFLGIICVVVAIGIAFAAFDMLGIVATSIGRRGKMDRIARGESEYRR